MAVRQKYVKQIDTFILNFIDGFKNVDQQSEMANFRGEDKKL